MARLRVGQRGFADVLVDQTIGARPHRLSEIADLVDWAPLDALLPAVRSDTPGEPGWPSPVLFRALLLQRWYGLSDPGLEEALADRLSFRRFCGLALADPVPDQTTLWRFRDRLAREGTLERVSAALSEQLEARGLIVKAGTLVDATVVRSAARRPRMDEPKQSATDPDARFGTTNERGRYEFGYKVHAAVDQGSGLVRAVVVTGADAQEVTVAPHLIPDDAGTVYADRGYDAGWLRARLAERGLGDGIMRRNLPTRRLDAAGVAANHARSLARRPVEALFGTFKRTYRMGRMRAYGMRRNAADVLLFAIAYNLRRWRTLVTTP